MTLGAMWVDGRPQSVQQSQMPDNHPEPSARLPPKDLRVVRAWLAPRRRALEAAFFAALRHEAPGTIIQNYVEATGDL